MPFEYCGHFWGKCCASCLPAALKTLGGHLLLSDIGAGLTRLPLSDAVKSAILQHEGSMGRALSCAIALDKGDWRGMEFESLHSEEMHDAYRGAIQWTYQVITAL